MLGSGSFDLTHMRADRSIAEFRDWGIVMRSYEAARTYFGILEFISWCVIILGFFAAIFGLTAVGQMGRGFGASPSGAAYITAVIPGAGLAFAGFLGLVLAQIGRAGVDSAEYGQQSLKIAREQLEISKQGLKQGAMSEGSYAALEAAKDELEDGIATGAAGASYADVGKDEETPAEEEENYQVGDILEYRTKEIRVVGAGYVFGSTVFQTLKDAKASIDEYCLDIPPISEEPAKVTLVSASDIDQQHVGANRS